MTRKQGKEGIFVYSWAVVIPPSPLETRAYVGRSDANGMEEKDSKQVLRHERMGARNASAGRSIVTGEHVAKQSKDVRKREQSEETAGCFVEVFVCSVALRSQPRHSTAAAEVRTNIDWLADRLQQPQDDEARQPANGMPQRYKRKTWRENAPQVSAVSPLQLDALALPFFCSLAESR